MKKTTYSLTVGWLYPSLMSTYGDRGNIISLEKRCEWRGIECNVVSIDLDTPNATLESLDLLFGGGAQDKEQGMIIKDLKRKGDTIKKLIDDGLPALFVCGAPQLLGHYYEPAEGKRIEGLGIFDMATKQLGGKQDRLIGNIAAKTANYEIVGFENHGGRTYLGKDAKPFAKVLKGYGNNGEDDTEGVVHKNAIGCYFHGPLLPKNPEIADHLIKKALERKYKKKINLEPLEDLLELNAKKFVMSRLGL